MGEKFNHRGHGEKFILKNSMNPIVSINQKEFLLKGIHCERKKKIRLRHNYREMEKRRTGYLVENQVV